MSDLVSAVLSSTGVVGIIGAATVFWRTRKLMRQQDRMTEASVIEQLQGTVGGFAEDVRRDAQASIDLIRRDAQDQIERSGHRAQRAEDRAEKAESRAVAAERAAVEAQIKAMSAEATVRRLTLAIVSPYATLEGLRSMVATGPSANGVG